MQIIQSCGSCSRIHRAVVRIMRSCTPCSRAECAVAQIMQSCISRNRANQAAVQLVRISSACPSVRLLARSLAHMLPVSLKMPLPPSPSPRLLSSLDELEASLSDSLLDPLLDPDPEPFELPGIMRP